MAARRSGSRSRSRTPHDDRARRRGRRAASTALRTSLRARELDVHESASGEDALVVAADRRPDIVLLDLGLPGIDGIETLTRLRAFTDVPVIVLTARSAPPTR